VKADGVRDRIVELVRVRAGDLVDHEANWRRHPARQRAALAAMLEEIGYANALVARRDGDAIILIDGHLRKSLDQDQVVPVLVLDVTAAEAEKLLLTLDPISALARPHPEALAALLERVRASSEAVADLFEGLARAAGLPLSALRADPEEIPVRTPPRTSPGDLWELGRHRLLCADATDGDAVHRLMAGERADLLVTDPPYGVGYVGKTPRALTIANDAAPGLKDLLMAAFSGASEVLAEGAPIYVFCPAGAGQAVFLEAFFSQGWRLHQGLVWVKDAPVIGHCDYAYQHEIILFGYSPSARRRGRGHGGWFGGNDQTSVLQVPKPARSPDHPTAKPVELIRRLVSNSSRRHQIVVDPFAGSGSALVACELLERRFFGIEIDPSYCDVAIARFEAVTGTRATRHRGAGG
jgi:DNA modification methylase